MMLQVTNWDKWQTYRKDRGTPPWIKVHRNLLSNPEWCSLSDSEKGQLVSIWLLSADKNGQVCADAQLLHKMAQLDAQPNINRFIELGFLSPSGCQGDAPETETETETEVVCANENNLHTPSRFDEFWDHWPIKRNKKRAKSVWQRNKLDSLFDKLVADVENRKKNDPQWMQGYIPHCSSYLAGERWNDENTDGKPQEYKPASHKMWNPPEWMVSK